MVKIRRENLYVKVATGAVDSARLFLEKPSSEPPMINYLRKPEWTRGTMQTGQIVSNIEDLSSINAVVGAYWLSEQEASQTEENDLYSITPSDPDDIYRILWVKATV